MQSDTSSPIDFDDLQERRAACRDLTDIVARKESLDHARKLGPFLREVMRDQASESICKLHENGFGRRRDDKREDVLFEGLAVGLGNGHLVGARTRGFNEVRLVDAIFEVDCSRLASSTTNQLRNEYEACLTRRNEPTTHSSTLSLPMI